MIYTLAFVPYAIYLLYCFTRDPSIYAAGVAICSAGAGLAAVVYRRPGLLGIGTVLAVVLYLMTAFPASSRFRLVEPLALGAALFLFVDLTHDLIVLRIRRIPSRAASSRLGFALALTGFSVALGVTLVVIAASTLRYLPGLAEAAATVPALAGLLLAFGWYVYRRSR